ncbi:MAG: hypothetical protein PUP91_22870 [Rhizonema sp. PD37]|nr:hypothetical protein [Rhizonema sp. PD37]
MQKNSTQKFAQTTTIIVCLFATLIAVFILAFPKLYEIKSKAGIDFIPGKHAGTLFEKHTHGLFKCEWLYPYHCDRSNT